MMFYTRKTAPAPSRDRREPRGERPSSAFRHSPAHAAGVFQRASHTRRSPEQPWAPLPLFSGLPLVEDTGHTLHASLVVVHSARPTLHHWPHEEATCSAAQRAARRPSEALPSASRGQFSQSTHLTALGLEERGQHQKPAPRVTCTREPGPGPPQGCRTQHSRASCTACGSAWGRESRSGQNCWELTLES